MSRLPIPVHKTLDALHALRQPLHAWLKRWWYADPTRNRKKRFSLAFTASVLVHVMLATMITLAHTDKPLPRQQQPKIMDVVLLDDKASTPKTPPKKADAISNRSATGASVKPKDRFTRTAKSPIVDQNRRTPRPTVPQVPRTPPPLPQPKPDKRTRTLARRGVTLENNAAKPPKKRHKPRPNLRNVPMANLMPSSMALAQLSRDTERERRLKKMLSREADVPVNTREAKFAPYAQKLVRALEEQWRPGQANYGEYPEHERRVLMRITINNNGELGRLEVLKPSPIVTLNDSAIAAVHAASPFRPLPSSWGLDRITFYLNFEVIEDRFVFSTL